jgi:hypothetical protein
MQYYCLPWWRTATDRQVRRGRLIWAFIPHVDQQPFVLVPEGRSNDTQHGAADYRFEPLRARDLPPAARLPVAALPHYAGEVRLVVRAKRRPALVVSTRGVGVEKNLRTGAARYQTSSTLLVAPYYGADVGGSTGGWKPEFVARIRRCAYPQYLWDSLPVPGRKESILRLDHVQPIGEHADSYELTDFELDEDALMLVDDYVSWFLKGQVPGNSPLLDIRAALLAP